MMKLGVTTLGCPNWTLDEILTNVKAYGYDGVELRGIGPDLDLTQSPHFATEAETERSRRRFADAGLEISTLDSSVTLAQTDAAKRESNLQHGRETIDLAARLGVPFVRVFGGGEDLRLEESEDLVAAGLAELGAYAFSTGQDVSVLLETHDAFSTGVRVAAAIARAAHPRAAALWDLHHPARHGEATAETYHALAPYTRSTHVKDSRAGGTYCLCGEGDIPLREMIGLLHAGGYDGYLTLEWEKRWIPELLEPEVAFSQYAKVLRGWLRELD
ncbi:MAG: Xylose isomerase protein barrel [Capsulimonas sp.]|jgi:sugar phosphate isomerase/epimerase|nr:Xylose isomerase protein barrel [Capsulimonas sp.]